MSGTGVFARIIEGEFTVADNPYYEQHVQGEIDYLEVRTRDAVRRARETVKDEFVRSGCHQPRQCPCGGRLWWRATVGAYICGGKPGGRQHMCHWNGEMLATSLEAIEQEKDG